MMESLNSAAGVSGDCSFDLRFVLPVVLRNLRAFCSNTTGAYVSLRNIKAEIEIAPPYSVSMRSPATVREYTHSHRDDPKHPPPALRL